MSRTLLASAALCLSCASSSPPTATASPAPEEESGAIPRDKKDGLPMPAGRIVSFEKELDHVSQVRGLSMKGELHGLEVEREELLAHVTRAVELEMPEKALVGTEAMLIGLGLVPGDFKYRETMLTLLSSKLAGLYDPHLNAMLIRAGLGEAERQMTLLHELVHALQDAHYDVMEVVEWAPDDTDRSGALSALAEGDATSAMFDGMMKNGETALSLPPGFIQEKMRADSSSPDGVPSIITRSLKASYIDGLSFVHALRRRGGFEEVDRVWKAPPKTTEQVLHLDKYDAGELPLEVPIPDAPSSDFRLILHDTWGEQNLRLVFEEWLPIEEAARAASGWGGDRIAAYRHDETITAVWHLVGDNEEAAKRFYAGFEKGIAEPVHFTEDEDRTCGKFAPSRPLLAVIRKGAHVLVGGSPLAEDQPAKVRCVGASGYLETQLEKIRSQSTHPQ